MDYKVESDSKKFYFGRQEDYSKYRPVYPIELFDFLNERFDIKNKTIVELGAGTGKFSKIASDYCKRLFYVEPNIDMLNKGKEYCREKTNISFVNACAEETTLDENVADMMFAVQSFHWFDKTKLKIEASKVLKENGLFAIVWNDWIDKDNAFSVEYVDYINKWNTKLTGKSYRHKNEEDRKKFFRNKEYQTYVFTHFDFYTLEMLIGLTKSLSYAPKEEDSLYTEFMSGVIKIFEKYQKENKVRFDFHTEMYIGNV